MPILQAGRPSRPGKSAGGFPTTALQSGGVVNSGGIQLVPTVQTQQQQQLPIATTGDELEDATQIPTTASSGPAFQFIDNTPGWKKFLLGVGGVDTPNVGMMNAQLALAHQAQQEQQDFEMKKLAAAGDIQRRNELDRINALPAANAKQAELIAKQAAQQRIDDATTATRGMIPDDAAKAYFSRIGVVPQWNVAKNSYDNPEAVKQAFDSLRANVDLDNVQNRALASTKEIPVGSLAAITPNLVSTATRREYANQAEADARNSGAEATDLENRKKRLLTSMLLNRINAPGVEQAAVNDNLLANLHAGLLAQRVHNQKVGEITVHPGETIFTTADGTQPTGTVYDVKKAPGIGPDGKPGYVEVSSPAAFIPALTDEEKTAAKAAADAKVKGILDAYDKRNSNVAPTTAVDASTLIPSLALTAEQKNELPPLYEPDNSALSKHNMAMSDLMRYARGGVALNPVTMQQDWTVTPNSYHPFTSDERLEVNKRIAEMLAKGRKLRGIPSTATQVK